MTAHGPGQLLGKCGHVFRIQIRARSQTRRQNKLKRRPIPIAVEQFHQYPVLRLKKPDELTFRSPRGKKNQPGIPGAEHRRHIHFFKVKPAIIVNAPAAAAFASLLETCGKIPEGETVAVDEHQTSEKTVA